MPRLLNAWTWGAPALGLLLVPLSHLMPVALVGLVLVGAVLAAVHHAELVALRVGEPFGTLVLALAVTVIEVGLIITLMSAAGADAATLARDTVFAAIMIILGGLLGACLLFGGLTHGEQAFRQTGVSAALACLGTLAVLTLVLPNFTVSAPGPVYSPAQLAFVAVVSFLLYLTFVAVQTVRHRDYFLPSSRAVIADEDQHAEPPTRRAALVSGALLCACLVVVVLLAKALAPAIEATVLSAGAPRAVVGVVIAALVLLPESVAAVRAARANRLQTSLNLALGSALATIGLTIPAVAALSLFTGLPIALGLDAKGMVLLFLTLFVASLSLSTGRTTILQGAVHLTIFAVYLFTTVVP